MNPRTPTNSPTSCNLAVQLFSPKPLVIVEVQNTLNSKKKPSLLPKTPKFAKVFVELTKPLLPLKRKPKNPAVLVSSQKRQLVNHYSKSNLLDQFELLKSICSLRSTKALTSKEVLDQLQKNTGNALKTINDFSSN